MAAITKTEDFTPESQTDGPDFLHIQAAKGHIDNVKVEQGNGADFTVIAAQNALIPLHTINDLQLDGGKGRDELQFVLREFGGATLTNNQDGTYSFNAPEQKLNNITFTHYDVLSFAKIDARETYEVTLKEVEEATRQTPTVNVADLMLCRVPR